MRAKDSYLDKYEWHEWFAWFPIYVQTGRCKGTWIFWERVQRRYINTYCGTDINIRNLDGSDIE